MKKAILVAGAVFTAILLVGISPEVRAQTNPGLMQKAPEAAESEPQVEPEAPLEKLQPKPAPSVTPPEKLQPKPAPSVAPSEKMQPRPAPPTMSPGLRKSAAESTPGTPAPPPEQIQDAAASKAKLEKQRREFTAAAADARRKLEERKGAAIKEQDALLKREVSRAQVEMEKLRKRARAADGQKIEPAPEALKPPQITGGLGALQGGNPLIVGGTSFGSQPGKVHLMAATGSLQLEIDEWYPGGIGGRVPALADTLCLTGEVQVERPDGKRSNTWIFSVPVIYKSLAQQDVAVLQCSDDGNYNLCNGVSPGDDPCAFAVGDHFATAPSSAGTITGSHSNCPGAVGDDSGVDTYEINLKNGWVLDSAGFTSSVPSGEGWTQPSSGHLPAGFKDGEPSWRPEIAWSVTPSDEVSYTVYVLIRGPECTSHK